MHSVLNSVVGGKSFFFFGVISRLLEERKTEVRLTSRLSAVHY